jgi:hypothetical protein
MDAAIAGTANWSIPIGTPVYDVAGEKLGSVSGMDGFSLLVEEGFLMITTHVIPMALVERYDDGALYLGVTKDELARAEENG